MPNPTTLPAPDGTLVDIVPAETSFIKNSAEVAAAFTTILSLTQVVDGTAVDVVENVLVELFGATICQFADAADPVVTPPSSYKK